MNFLILIKSNATINVIEDCKTRAEFMAYTIKSLLPDYMTITIKNCNQNINNIQIDFIMYINETGFYYETCQFAKNINNITILNKNCKVLSFGISNKFYTIEDIMFGITQSTINDKYMYVYPPLNEDLYISRNTDYFCIFFDYTQNIYDPQIMAICEIMKKLSADINVIICTINTRMINYYDLDLNFIETMTFDSYIDYINELSKANLYFVTNICSDVYKLYELSMCNIPIISHELCIPKNIVDELDIYTYLHINNINWITIFYKLQNFNIRSKLIMNNYSWINFISTLINEISKQFEKTVQFDTTILNIKNTQLSNIELSKIQEISKTLNIGNCNRPYISNKLGNIHDNNVMEKIYEILDIVPKEKPKPQRKILLQSQILHL